MLKHLMHALAIGAILGILGLPVECCRWLCGRFRPSRPVRLSYP
jgi:hypothetical protein